MKSYFSMNTKYLSFLIFIYLLFLSSSLDDNICSASKSEIDNEKPFDYQENSDKGPSKWGDLNPHWRVCNNGKFQSPIDIHDQNMNIFHDRNGLKRDYQPARAILKNRGHDIMVRWDGDGGQISINQTYYKLLQCHWHSPSEHTINGSRYQLELHIVHQSSNGEKAVTAILYKYGRPDRFLSRLFHHIKSIGEEEKNLGRMNPGDIKVGSRKYYRYIGSLTVPPCTQGVVWTIVEKVRTVSREQVRALRDVVHDGFESNARPIQALGRRQIWMYTP